MWILQNKENELIRITQTKWYSISHIMFDNSNINMNSSIAPVLSGASVCSSQAFKVEKVKVFKYVRFLY